MTMIYSSPQRCRCVEKERALCLSDDVYSFGVLCFELFSREEPFAYAFVGNNAITTVDDFVQRRCADTLSILCPDPESSYIQRNAMLRNAALMGVWEKVAFRCVQFEPGARPAMTEAVAGLVEPGGSRMNQIFHLGFQV